MKTWFIALAAVIAACRFALGADGASAAAPFDPFAFIVKLAVDYGALGLFVAFLLLDRKKERERRDRDAERWYAMDRSLIDRMEANTVAMLETANAQKELRDTIRDSEKVLQAISATLAAGAPQWFRARDKKNDE